MPFACANVLPRLQVRQPETLTERPPTTRARPSLAAQKESSVTVNSTAEAYNANPQREWDRLVKDPYHTLEFLATWHHLQQYLPATGRVLDAGGGPGRYALELCRAGYEVVLLDLSAGILAVAKERFQCEPVHAQQRLLEVVEGDIRDLSRFAPNSFDAVLCLGGPLTHLGEEADRLKALKELVRVVRPGGIVSVGVMGYWAVLRTVLAQSCEELAETSFQTLVQTGNSFMQATGSVWHFFRAEELRRCCEQCGLTTLIMAGCEGLSTGLVEATNAVGGREAQWHRWVELVLQTSAEPSLVDMSEHILHIGRADKV